MKLATSLAGKANAGASVFSDYGVAPGDFTADFGGVAVMMARIAASEYSGVNTDYWEAPTDDADNEFNRSICSADDIAGPAGVVETTIDLTFGQVGELQKEMQAIRDSDKWKWLAIVRKTVIVEENHWTLAGAPLEPRAAGNYSEIICGNSSSFKAAKVAAGDVGSVMRPFGNADYRNLDEGGFVFGRSMEYSDLDRTQHSPSAK